MDANTAVILMLVVTVVLLLVYIQGLTTGARMSRRGRTPWE